VPVLRAHPVADNCPGLRTSNINDADGNGIGDMCECGDQTGDGFVNVMDILAIYAAIFDPSLATPLCDTNNDDLCDVQDLLGANAKIFGAPAFCAKYVPSSPPSCSPDSGDVTRLGDFTATELQT
jgi:hypothetical protein